MPRVIILSKTRLNQVRLWGSTTPAATTPANRSTNLLLLFRRHRNLTTETWQFPGWKRDTKAKNRGSWLSSIRHGYRKASILQSTRRCCKGIIPLVVLGPETQIRRVALRVSWKWASKSSVASVGGRKAFYSERYDQPALEAAPRSIKRSIRHHKWKFNVE
jgi:hypothetical protein